LKKNDPLTYHQRVWQTELLCPGGGKYIWDEKYKTYESTAFGHPAKPKTLKNLSILGHWKNVNLGVNFENDGLRVKGSLQKIEAETKIR
jgi:hypothetical protein